MMSRRLNLSLIAIVLMFCSGCELYKGIKLPALPDLNINTPVVKVDDPRGMIPKVKMALSGASAEDCETLRKFCLGVSLYAQNTTVTPTFNKLSRLLNKVQTDYGWQNNKYPAFNDVTETDLKSIGLSVTNQDLNIIKDLVSSTFRTYAEACRQMAEEKRVK